MAPHWQHRPEGDAAVFADWVDYQAMLCDAGLAPKTIVMPEYAGHANYAYHLDAGKFATLLRDQLHAVADPEDRDAEVVDRRVERRCALDVHALGATGEDDPLRVAGAQFGGGDRVRHDLGVDVRLAYAPGNELRVLGAEVHHEDGVELSDLGLGGHVPTLPVASREPLARTMRPCVVSLLRC